MSGRRLALITPIRNERDQLAPLRDTVMRQETRPDLWVIVVGRSDDGSLEAAQETFSGLDWVEVVPQTSYFPGHGHMNFARGVNDGLKRIMEVEGDRPFQYLSKIDATVDLDADYFRKLTEELDSDDGLSLVCGVETFAGAKGKGVPVQPSGDEIIGFNDNRVYRREFLVGQGGYPVSISPDTVLLVRSHKAGWRQRVVTSTGYKEGRLGFSKEGAWSGYFQWGRGMYRLDYHPLLVLSVAVYFGLRFRPHYQGLALPLGFFRAFVGREERIDDAEVRKYFREERLYAVARSWFGGR
ncbi:MAG: glycosyltransferase family 2 protein [Euryarchaeota archaeon]|mgnify:FL=1|nr:glycosyltransferase family 2 protein [Euryarchaeota archaeon]